MEKKEEEESEEKEKAKTRQGRSGVVIPDFKLNEVGDRDLSVYLCVFLCLYIYVSVSVSVRLSLIWLPFTWTSSHPDVTEEAFVV